MRRLKTAALGGLVFAGGAAACWKRMIRVPLKEFARYALYMAVMDDEICRNELEGNQIGAQTICFRPREETIQEKYHLFLSMNRKKSRKQLRKEIGEMERRLRDSRRYVGQPKAHLEIEISGKYDS